MALSMEEQRILAEIEERLERAEPGLAARLSSFGRPAVHPPRTVRALLMASFIAVAVMAFVSVMLYALAPLRALPGRATSAGSVSAPANPVISAPGGAAGTPRSVPLLPPRHSGLATIAQ